MAADFEALIDLAISKGHSHSQVLSAIRSSLLEHLKTNYPNLPIGLDLVVNTQTGSATVTSDSKDITPKQFLAESPSISRLAVIKLITPQDEPAKFTLPYLTMPKISIDWLLKIIFWGYNGLACLYLLLLFLGLSTGFRTSAIELMSGLNFYNLLLLVLSALLPFASTIYALKHRLSSHQTASFFVLWQIPTTLLLVFFSSFFSQVTPLLMLGSLLLLFVPVHLYSGYADHDEHSTTTLSYVLKHLVLFAGVYSALIITLLTPLLIGNYFNWIVDNNFFIFDPPITIQPYEEMRIQPLYYGSQSYRSLPEKLFMAGVAMAGFAIVLILSLLPFLIIYKVFLSTQSTRKHYIAVFGKARANRILLIILIILLGLTLTGGRYGSDPLLSDLQAFSQATNFSDREKLATRLIPRQAEIQTLIRKSSSTQQNFFDILDVKSEYIKTFSLSPSLAQLPDSLYQTLTRPLMSPDSQTDYTAMQNAYYDLFNQPYYSETSYLKPPSQVNQVRLVSRSVSSIATDSGLLGVVTTVDEYQNLGFNQQEVVYEFSLPAGSVISDLKLGPNLEFPGQIAPRGAAETVYIQEMNRRRDPALIEQIGTNHYRLRVFPVPSQNETLVQGTRLKVSWSYITGNTPSGLPLPVYTSTSNLKIDSQSTFSGTQSNSKYLPQAFNCKETSYSGFNLNCSGTVNQRSTKAALLLDVSHSAKDIDQHSKLAELSKLLGSNSQVDYYRFNSQLSDPESTIPQKDNLVYFGTSDIANVLPKLESKYEAVFVFTPSAPTLLKKPSSPTFLIHPDSKYPAYTQQTTLDLLQSGGLSTTNVEEAFKQYEINVYNLIPKIPADYSTPIGSSLELTVARFIAPPALSFSDTTSIDSLAAGLVVNRQLIVKTTPVFNDLNFLDSLHQLAKEAGIVTLVSSNIALVNSTQQQNLDNLSQYYNRYEQQDQSRPAPLPTISNSDTFSRRLLPNIGSSVDLQQINLGSPGVGVTMEKANQVSPSNLVSNMNLIPAVFLGLIFVVFLPYFLLRRKK